MKKISIITVLLSLLSGCALTPPAPPSCEGEFYPINVPKGE